MKAAHVLNMPHLPIKSFEFAFRVIPAYCIKGIQSTTGIVGSH